MTCNDAEAAPPGVAASCPLLFVTLNVTVLFAKGVTPSSLSSFTTIGAGKSTPTGPCWAPPDSTVMIAPVAGSCNTVTWATAVLPRKSIAVTVIGVASTRLSGTAGAKKVPFVPIPTSMAAGMPLTSTWRPLNPERTSLTRPATSTLAVVKVVPLVGKSMNTFGGATSRVIFVLAGGLSAPRSEMAVTKSALT